MRGEGRHSYAHHNCETLLCFTQTLCETFTSYPTSARAYFPRARRALSPVHSHKSSHKPAVETGFLVPSPSPPSSPSPTPFRSSQSTVARHQQRAQRPSPPTRVESYPHPMSAPGALCSCHKRQKSATKRKRNRKMPARMRCRDVARASVRPWMQAPLAAVLATMLMT
jgi:hypothetical protein